jgi:serine/threonine protein kinase
MAPPHWSAQARELEAATDLAPGDLVGPYRIESLLGQGGMGLVYRATGRDGETVALKLVRGKLAADYVYRKRFEREARAAERVSHPHVVPVLATGEHDGVPYMAQEFVRGGTLQDKLDRDGPLPLEPAVTLCLEVAKGLGALHAERLVHRDLKPSNILLDEDGRAFITDFGLAKDRDASVLTAPGKTVGSLDYMAPEQIRAEDVSPAVDVYALGCVMFQCLSGTPPFGHREGMQILWAHMREDPPDPSARRDDIPDDVGWAVSRALEKDPARRPPTPTAYARMVQVAAGVPPLSPGRN